MTWTDKDVLEWAWGLGSNPIASIKDLLAHVGTDHMSAEDRIICQRALGLLGTHEIQ